MKDVRTNQEKIQSIIYDYCYSNIGSSCLMIDKKSLSKIAERIEKEIINKKNNNEREEVILVNW